MSSERDARASRDDLAESLDRIPLAKRAGEFILDEEGLQLVSSRSPFSFGRGALAGLFASPKIPYETITHFASSPFGFWLATKRDIFSLRRSRFDKRDGPERLNEALIRAIARRRGGFDQLARISQIHTLARGKAPQHASRWLALFCVAVYVLQLRDPFLTEVSVMVPRLVDSGQVYRLISANFLHGISVVPLHLIFNAVGLVGLALLVERPLGPLRTSIVMGASGLVAMLSSYAVGGADVLGASGIVMGLAGAALCLELHSADRLPVWWRIPRRPFIALLILESTVGFVLPFVAGEAHFGGMVAGYVTTRAMLSGGALPRRGSPWLRRTAMAMGVVVFFALGNVAFLVLRQSNALDRYGRQLLATEGISVDHDNGTAWRMATESRASIAQLETAQRLAERAADRTQYSNPEILDTLAEVLFIRGDQQGALELIEEAIRITRGETYYLEQRRRFLGERDFEDRPAPPLPWRDGHPSIDEPGREPGLVV